MEAAADAGRRSRAPAQPDGHDRSREPVHHRRHPAAQRQRTAVRGPAGQQQDRVPVLVQLLPADPDRCQAQALGRSRPVVLRRRDRQVGRRHAGHRFDRLQGREGLDRRERQPAQRRAARRRTLDAAGRRPHPRRHADRGPEVLHAAVHVRANVGARQAGRGDCRNTPAARTTWTAIIWASDRVRSVPTARAATSTRRRCRRRRLRTPRRKSSACPLRRISATSSARCRAAHLRSIRAAGIISAHAVRRCWLDTICRAPARGRATASRDREPTMWRYREMMPVFAGESPVTLGEGFTPLMHARALGAALGLDRLYIKDESLNPTNSFKARGPVRGHHAGAWPRRDDGFGAIGRQRRQRDGGVRGARGDARQSLSSRGRKTPFARECQLYGADVTLVDGLITDAARVAAERGGPLGWYDVSTLKEPYRIEGKKTMAYELAEQMDWTYPTGSSIRPVAAPGMVGMWKAFDEMERIGWMQPQRRPRMVSVQAEGCAPIVRAFSEGTEKAAMWEGAPHSGRWPARAARDRRFPDSSRSERERRHGARRLRHGHGRRHARDRRRRRRQRRPRKRRHVRRAAGACRTR